jgi:UPF0176 protein
MSFHISFYRFVALSEPHAIAVALREIASELLGVVLLASEGINGTLAGSADALDRFESALASDARFGGAFVALRFQRTACVRPPFAKLKVHVRKEIVHIGVNDVDALQAGGVDVAPEAWDALIARDDVVLIDNRNHFEYALGHVRGALDPKVSLYSDFARFMQENLPHWQAAGKQIAMYCTGGIRCEKTSAWLAGQGVRAYQLEGGILNYLRCKQGQPSQWQGECFVFDNRMALDANLQESALAAEAIYRDPEDAWRLARARRLAQATEADRAIADANE